jgi:translin
MPASTAPLASQQAAIVARFQRLNAARDRALDDGRQAIRLSANAIRALHRAEHAEADALLAEARALVAALTADLRDLPGLYWQGYVQDAMKEYAEAAITVALVRDEPVPGPEALGVEDAPWLNALAEAASELRREALDHLRRGDAATAERLLAAMDDVYDLLVSIDFPDGITGGLRRTTDQLRGVLERTRADLTLILTQERLSAAIDAAQRRFDQAPG